MRSRPLWKRALGRLRREMGARRHAAADEEILRRFRDGGFITADESRLVSERLDSAPPEPLVLPESPIGRVRPTIDRQAALVEAGDAIRGSIRLFGREQDLLDPSSWHRDPLRSTPWPDCNHARIRLDDPGRGGDARMAWEPARFHNALLLARAHLVAPESGAAGSLLAQIESFETGCSPFRTIHWAVGMEVAIRGAALCFALESLRGAPELTAGRRERIVRLLFLHGLFLEHHIERNPLGFTTNHTIADHAGLCILGQLYRGADAGERWRAIGAAGLRECLAEQVLAGGAHAEGSLPYERFCLEAGLAAFAALPSQERVGLDGPLRALALHLRAAALPSGLPFIGDGDDSFFPPFACRPFEALDPLDPEPVLQAAEALLALPGLRLRRESCEAAIWLGAAGDVESGTATPRAVAGSSDAAATPPASAPPPSPSGLTPHARGFIPFDAPPLRGLIVARDRHQGWLPTHAHNDLLSIVLDLAGEPLLIDPGTGGYGCDRALRHRLRSTGAHSTLELAGREQSPIDPRTTFEGPASISCGARVRRADRPDIACWHEGFGEGLIHTRRVRVRMRLLFIEDVVSSRDAPGAPEAVESILRFRLGPGARVRVEENRRGQACAIDLPSGTARFILLRPASASWQIGAEPISRRYGSAESAPVLEARHVGPPPHRWLTVVRAEAPRNRS
ncbi:MAG: hypothetical protein FJY88_10495 [Candidatus Eisenbacteria bacterium]|nr:hypothetical protein [Candidatus Eisenbacteria bacterium]